MEAPNEQFISDLTDWQNRLFGYLVTILGNVHDAHDVLQETNVVMWRKIGEFEPGSNFGAWAKKCAHFQALAFLRDRKRDRHVFDDDVLERLAEDEETALSPSLDEEKEIALRECLAALPDDQRRLVRDRYRDELSIKELSSRFGKKVSATKMTLMRIRDSLLLCIEGKLKENHS
ncbi:MAG: sigma-70 family RNA polymerase sigma factor [Verrucomicrobiota bacterium]